MKHRLCIILFCIFAPLWIYPAQLLDWQTCSQEALSQNLDVQSAQKAVLKTETELGISDSDYLPQLNLSGTYAQTTSEGTTSTALTLSQKLFPGLNSKPEMQRAKAHLKEAQATLKSVISQLKADLVTAFAQLKYTQDAIKLNQYIADRRTQNANLVHARYLAGREHKGSYLRAQAQADQAMLEVKQTQRDLDIARESLCVLLNKPVSDSFAVTGEIKLDPLPQNPPFDTLLLDTPSVIQAQAKLEASLADQTITSQSYDPSITASYALSQTLFGSSEGTGRLSLSIPLYNGSKGSYDRESAKLSLTIAEIALSQAKNQVRLDLKKAWVSALDTLENVAMQNTLVTVALIRSEIAEAQYNTGILSFDNWDIIENDLISQQKLALINQRNASTSLASFENIQGKGF